MVCQDTPTKKISKKIGNRMWRGCRTMSKKLFLDYSSEIYWRRCLSKTSILRSTFEKSDIRKWGKLVAGRPAGHNGEVRGTLLLSNLI